MEPQKSIVLPLSLAILASAIVFGGLGYYLANGKNATETTVTPTYTTQTIVTTQPTTTASTATPQATPTITQGWVSKAIPELNVTFDYPEKLGALDHRIDDFATTKQGT